MTPESTLPVIAQIAATFAGFTALVSVVDQGQGGKWAKISIWRILQMVILSLGVMLMCLLPAVLSGFGIEDDLMWRICVIISLLFFVGNWVRTPLSARKLNKNSPVRINKITMALIFVTMSATALVSFLSLTGVTPITPKGAYLLNAFSGLFGISAIFFALVQQLDIQHFESNERLEKSDTASPTKEKEIQ